MVKNQTKGVLKVARGGSQVTAQSSSHPGHHKELVRLKRAIGQLQAVERMIGEGRYCMDIIQQLKAASAAVNGIQGSVLQTHLEGCVKSAFNSKDPIDSQEKIREIVELFRK